MPAKTKVGIIGCGAIGGIHADGYSKCADAELAAVADILPEKAEALAAQHGVGLATANYKDILADPSIGAVSVCTPNDLHCPMTLDALRAGKHVLCEKPIALNLTQAKKMHAEAKRRERLLAIGVVNRFNTYVELMKEAIASGQIGEVYHTRFVFKNYRCIPGLGGWFTTKARSGGGVMIDWGVHFLDLVFYCLGGPKPQAVSGVAHAQLARDIRKYAYLDMWAGPPDPKGTCDVEEYVSGLLRTDGPTVAFEGAWAQNIDDTSMFIEFLGDKGGIRADYGGGFTLYTDKDGVLYQRKATAPAREMYVDEIVSFIDCARTGKASRADIEHVLPSQAVIDAFYKSAATGREVKIRQ